MSKYIHIDIMVNGRYLCTMRKPHCPAFRLSIQELRDYIEKQRPSLAGKTYDVYFN